MWKEGNCDMDTRLTNTSKATPQQLKNGYSGGTKLADKDSSVCIHANTEWSGNLTCTNRFHQRSIRLEHLDATVRVISHQDVVIGINKEMMKSLKLTNTNMMNKIALGIKDGNPTAAVLTNNNISC